MALKAKEVRVEVSLNEKIMIAKNYEKTRCNWPRILENIRSNIDELPGQAKSLYQEGDFQKLRRRMSDQMKKLTKEGAIITNEELKEIVERIREMESRYSGQAGDHPKDKEIISKKLCKKEIEAVVKRRMLDDDHREGAIQVPEENPSSSDDDEPPLVQGPPPAPRKSTSELARETYEAVKESIDRGKQLESKMDKCMDKFLSM
ncbi:unnamed protein product [Mytilus edulis]|uniref:Uncharacterized protein n=1 Tax=Mytilus edulis TaxID=6550 RepID=A0A8S3Q4G5_MYTED|nr:unnamed protein product [Mytilus edulis]